MLLYFQQMLYLCNIQTITTANITQKIVFQNIFNQKVTNMEEEKINEAQVTEQTTSQEVNKVESELDVILNENASLKKQLKSAKDGYDYANRRWGELLRDVENYKALIRIMMDELKWDDATAIGKISVAGGMDVFEFIERQH